MSSNAPSYPGVIIRGMHFRGEAAKQYAEAMQSGDKLSVEREPENKFDTNAIKVVTPHGMHLGYIGKEYAAWIAGWIDEGVVYECICEEVVFEKNNHYPVVTLRPVEAEAEAASA